MTLCDKSSIYCNRNYGKKDKKSCFHGRCSESEKMTKISDKNKSTKNLKAANNPTEESETNCQKKLKRDEKIRKKSIEYKTPIYRNKIQCPKRLCATQDFVYEMKLPEDSLINKESTDSNQLRAYKYSKEIFTSKLDGPEGYNTINNKNLSLTLPKVKANNEFLINTFDKRNNKTIPFEHTSLPSVNFKKLNIFEVNENEDITSHRQKCQQKCIFQNQKYFSDSEADKAYNILENLNKAINKIRKSHSNMRKRDYLHKTAIKSFKDVPGIGFKEPRELRKMLSSETILPIEQKFSNTSNFSEAFESIYENSQENTLKPSINTHFSDNLIKSSSPSILFNNDINASHVIKSDSHISDKIKETGNIQRTKWSISNKSNKFHPIPTSEEVADILSKIKISDYACHAEAIENDPKWKHDDNIFSDNKKIFDNNENNIEKDQVSYTNKTVKEEASIKDFVSSITNFEALENTTKSAQTRNELNDLNGIKQTSQNYLMEKIFKSDYLKRVF